MFKWGFELEGFFKEGEAVSLPPTNYPTDGFAGIVEVRNTGGNSDIADAYYALFPLINRYPNVDYSITEHVFSGKERQLIRQRGVYKEPDLVSNLYNKEPKLLGNKTLASFQVNVSRQSTSYVGSDSSIKVTNNLMFDMPKFIRNMDEEFAKEIKDSGRQIGCYAVKDNCRLEYRSLPNSVFTTDLASSAELIKRIKNCLNN